MNELWKDVVGYEGIYEVSSKGRVRTHKIKLLGLTVIKMEALETALFKR